MYENIKIETVEEECQLCEDYAKKNLSEHPKVAILSCEGACSRGEISRLAANLVAHRLSQDKTVRICLGGAFTKNAGQRNLVKNASKVISIEGCFIDCASRMMKGVIPDLKALVVQADSLYDIDLPFGINEVSEDILKKCATKVAETIVKEYIEGNCKTDIKPSSKCCNKDLKSCCE
ncbi:MAG: putative zinc-binding protein [Bacillota bacterium]|nr:putative zinc-binding protein [Bacillota bacterium]